MLLLQAESEMKEAKQAQNKEMLYSLRPKVAHTPRSYTFVLYGLMLLLQAESDIKEAKQARKKKTLYSLRHSRSYSPFLHFCFITCSVVCYPG